MENKNNIVKFENSKIQNNIINNIIQNYYQNIPKAYNIQTKNNFGIIDYIQK